MKRHIEPLADELIKNLKKNYPDGDISEAPQEIKLIIKGARKEDKEKYAEAIRYYKKSKKLGSLFSILKLAQLYFKGTVKDKTEDDVFILERDFHKARKYAKMLPQNAEALFILGMIKEFEEDPNNLEIDKIQVGLPFWLQEQTEGKLNSFDYYCRAFDIGHAGATEKLYNCYMRGIHVEKNPDKAWQYMKFSAKDGNTENAYILYVQYSKQPHPGCEITTLYYDPDIANDFLKETLNGNNPSHWYEYAEKCFKSAVLKGEELKQLVLKKEKLKKEKLKEEMFRLEELKEEQLKVEKLKVKLYEEAFCCFRKIESHLYPIPPDTSSPNSIARMNGFFCENSRFYLNQLATEITWNTALTCSWPLQNRENDLSQVVCLLLCSKHSYLSNIAYVRRGAICKLIMFKVLQFFFSYKFSKFAIDITTPTELVFQTHFIPLNH